VSATANPEFVLASASPRRRELLCQIGARFAVCPVDVDETHIPGESPEAYVQRLAEAKARAALGRLGPLPVLGSDTTVVVGDTPMGKPGSEAEGVAMLMALSGRSHRVLTAVAMVSAERCEWRLSQTPVTFASLDEDLCRRYWRTGEPADKAGGYAIQGRGAVFVAAISGSYSGVVGLPLAETRELLALFGLGYWYPEGLPGTAAGR